MASDTAIARAETGAEAEPAPKPFVGSRLGRLILFLNLLGLAVLIGGALVLNEFRRGLVEARVQSLSVQGQLIADIMAATVTRGDPEPAIELGLAAQVLSSRFIPAGQRARLFDREGRLVADSYTLSDEVEVRPLPPARGTESGSASPPFGAPKPGDVAAARKALAKEVEAALAGSSAAQLRRSESGERVVSVSIPIQRVQAVLGVLTLEAGDVDQIVAAQRKALIPFILIAVGVTVASSLLLNRLVADPVLRLARAADRVRLSRARAISLPDLSDRDDEVGDLTRSLEAMTAALSQRMDAIERFAADVAHEIRNPLTSLRSAVETLDLVSDDRARRRLLDILKQDVSRLDRLITDISNASRLDAELSRERPKTVDLVRLLQENASFYADTGAAGPAVRLVAAAGPGAGPACVSGREGPLGQVFRNLIDNARSFSPPGGEVRLAVDARDHELQVTVDDDGPGVPPENLETVFERFYTSRPKGAAFGGNSGLGLSIARQIVEAHGGRIWAENRTGDDGRLAGARFVVALPEVKP